MTGMFQTYLVLNFTWQLKIICDLRGNANIPPEQEVYLLWLANLLPLATVTMKYMHPSPTGGVHMTSHSQKTTRQLKTPLLDRSHVVGGRQTNLIQISTMIKQSMHPSPTGG